MATCGICCEAFNKSTRTSISCASCDAETCKACVVRFLLETTKDPHCMHCNVMWNAEFLDDNLTHAFITGKYREHRRNVLHEREMAMMSETVPFAELRKKEIEMLVTIKELRSKLKWHKTQMQQGVYMYAEVDLNADWTNIVKDADDILTFNLNMAKDENKLQQSIFLAGVLKRKTEELATGRIGVKNEASKPAQKYIRPCTNEACNGFITQGMVCKLCDTSFCKQCHEPLDPAAPEHACKLEDVESAKAIMKEAKPCPKCHTLTYKISGCSQMWCTQCRTPWCWNRGVIETGPIHNPMYFDFIRTQTNNTGPADVNYVPNCNVLPDEFAVRTKLRQLRVGADTNEWVYEILQSHRHIDREATICELTPLFGNRDLRVMFMVREIDDKEFKRRLAMRERANQKKRELAQIWTMMRAVLGDLLHKFMGVSVAIECNALYREYQAVCEFSDAAVKRLVQRYKCAPIVMPGTRAEGRVR